MLELEEALHLVYFFHFTDMEIESWRGEVACAGLE